MAFDEAYYIFPLPVMIDGFRESVEWINGNQFHVFANFYQISNERSKFYCPLTNTYRYDDCFVNCANNTLLPNLRYCKSTEPDPMLRYKTFPLYDNLKFTRYGNPTRVKDTDSVKHLAYNFQKLHKNQPVEFGVRASVIFHKTQYICGRPRNEGDIDFGIISSSPRKANIISSYLNRAYFGAMNIRPNENFEYR